MWDFKPVCWPNRRAGNWTSVSFIADYQLGEDRGIFKETEQTFRYATPPQKRCLLKCVVGILHKVPNKKFMCERCTV